jgi:DNA repair exonuclease SbcCD ATPase subunit/DNA repair exonuclease SbcCD nuclease subunit
MFITRINRIIHLADIHVRLFKRHEEYRKCFETLYHDIKAIDVNEEDVIVIAGDIVHSKTELSPEMVSLVSSFLTNLASLTRVIVIAGNHDCNLSNSSRLDALTPIIHNLNNKNIFYWKESGRHPLANIDFYVCSVFGDQANWPKINPHSNSIKQIALFHGPIHNAVTDVGYTVTNRHVMIETFDGFDAVLLGDIHRYQVLQERDVDKQKPVIVYPGSLIQQNHGEAPKGHGWVEWDVATLTHKFHELHNESGYYTLRVENGVVPNYDDMPHSVRLRIFAGDMEQSEIKKLVTTIRATHNVLELSVTNFTGTKSTSVATSAAVGAILDVGDVMFQNKLIIEFVQKKLPEVTPEVLDKVIKLNLQTNLRIDTDDLARKVTWRPLSLTFDNLFTYGPGNHIDFTKLNGVAGIFAPNASGKTSVAEAICFALYDRTPRTNRAANIMNTSKTTCFLEFKFEVEGIEYTVVRKGTKNKKGEVKIDVDFTKVQNGATISLNGEERRYTDQNIAKVVGDYEDFILTTFSSSSQAGLFVDRGQSDRKDLLGQFLGLNIFDRLHTVANEESKDVAAALKQFKKDDFTQELADTQQQIETEYTVLDTARRMLDETNTQLNTLSEKINDLHAKKVPLHFTPNLPALETARDEIATKIQRLEAAREDFLKQNAENNQFLMDYKDRMANAAWSVDRIEEAKKHIADEKNLEHELIRTRDRVDSYAKQMHRFKAQYANFDPNCEKCVINSANLVADMAANEIALREATTTMHELETSHAKLTENEVEIQSVLKAYDDYKHWSHWKATAEHKAETFALKLKSVEEQTQFFLKDFDLALKNIEDYNSMLATVQENLRLDDQITDNEKVKTNLKVKFNERTNAVQNQAAKIAVLLAKKKDMVAKIEKAKELETQFEAYRAYLAAVCRDGLPYQLVADVLPNLEYAVNNLLSQMVDFTVAFDTDGKNVNMRIAYDQDRVWPLELASGMEKFVTGLAIRVALTTVSALPKSNFLILDEGLGTLDAENLSSIFMLFDVLRTQFDFIFLISHVDVTRDIADTLIEIHRSNGLSRIEVA